MITSLILNAVSLLGVMILPHVSAPLAIAAVLFIACVIYTIITIQAGFAYWRPCSDATKRLDLAVKPARRRREWG